MRTVMWVAVKSMVPIRVIDKGYIGVIWGIMEKKMETTIMGSMGGCHNHGPFLGTLNIRCRIIIRIQKGTISLTTTHVAVQQVSPGTKQRPKP